MKNIKTLLPKRDNGNGKTDKYFSFGLSVKRNPENENDINEIETLISTVKNKLYGTDNVKNKTVIIDLLTIINQITDKNGNIKTD
jgi:hypothetical protein